MATPDEVIQLTQAQEAVRRLKEEMKQAQLAIESCDRAMKSAPASSAQFAQIQQTAAMQYRRAADQLKEQEKAVSKLGPALGQSQRGMQNFGYAVLYASQGIEDMQYGIQNAANNLPILAMALGAGPGLAGTLSLVATGATLVARNWEKLEHLWGGGATKTEAERMEKLAKATEKTLEQTAQLEAYTKRKGQTEGMKGGVPGYLTENRGAVQKALNESGGFESLTGSVMATMPKGMGGLDPSAAGYEEAVKIQTERHAIAAAEQQSGKKVAAGYKKELKARYEKVAGENATASKTNAEEILRKAEFEPGGLAALIRRVEKNPGAFPRGTLDKLKAATPARRLEAEQLDATYAEEHRLNQAEVGRGEAAVGQFTDAYQKRYADERARGTTSEYDNATGGYSDHTAEMRLAAQIKKEVAPVLADHGASDREINKFVEQYVRNIEEGFLNAVRKEAAANPSLSKARAEELVRERLNDPAGRGAKLKQEQRELELSRAAIRNPGGDDLFGSKGSKLAEGADVDPLVRSLMMLRTNRDQGGAGMNSAQAADFARRNIVREAMLPGHLGGRGLDQVQANKFADGLLGKAAPEAQQRLEQAFSGVASTMPELVEQLKHNTAELVRLEREGVSMMLPKRGGRRN